MHPVLIRLSAVAFACFVAGTGSIAQAKESVFFRSGFTLEVDSHAQIERTFVFRIGEGTLEFPASDVSRIELLPEKPAPPVEAAVLDVAQRPEAILNEAAYRTGLDEDFVRSVAKVESGWRQSAVSPKGAQGLMQLMPATAERLHVDAALALDNAKGGAQYLRELLIRYHGNSALTLAAYNAGPGAVSRYGGVPPYLETRRYVVEVLREYDRCVRSRAKLAKVVNTASASKPSATN